MLFGILLTIQILVCLALGGLVLIQRSEGGALGMGGGPAGLVSARGAGNLLTKATSVLGILFFALAIAMTIVGNIESRRERASALESLDTSGLTVQTPAQQTQQPAPAAASQATSSAPSLADLPLGAVTSSAAPAAQAPASQAPASQAPASQAPAAKAPAP
ncbi:preprotein translocase subunit SecG, partial [Asticcacaulis biprosthecium]